MAKPAYSYLEFLDEYKTYFRVKTFCTEKEVDKLEAKLGTKFPACYRELYLRLGSYDAFKIGPENSFTFPDYKGMNAAAKRIAANWKLELDVDDNLFVFCCFEENDLFWFFKLDEGDNPPIYMYEGGEEQYIKVADNLPELIKRMDWYRGYLLLKRDHPR
jgi:hypothetical protein